MFLMDSGRFRSAGIKSDMRKIAIRIRPAFKSRTYFSHGATKSKNSYSVIRNARRASARLVNSQNRKSIVNRSHLKAFTGKYAPILLSSPYPVSRFYRRESAFGRGFREGRFFRGRRLFGSEPLVKTVFQDKIMSQDTL